MIKFRSLIYKYLFKLLFSKDLFLIPLNNTELYIAPRSWDILIIKEIWYDECYSPNLLKKDFTYNTIVDLGAQNGYFSIWAAKEFNPRRIISVEPFPEILNKNILKNNLQEIIEVSDMAIYKDDSQIAFTHTPFNSGLRRINSSGKGKLLNTISFKNLMEQKEIKTIDLLKIDIEGSERYVLTDENAHFLKNNVRYIVMESHDCFGYTKEMAKEFLHKIGYETYVENTWWLQGVNHIQAVNRN